MSQQDSNRTLLRFPGAQREFSVARPTARDFAMLEELSFAWREAQAEARAAYEDWRIRHSGETYCVYRAAQDRADAAHDALAAWTLEMQRVSYRASVSAGRRGRRSNT